jgi:hypothetical protein
MKSWNRRDFLAGVLKAASICAVAEPIIADNPARTELRGLARLKETNRKQLRPFLKSHGKFRQRAYAANAVLEVVPGWLVDQTSYSPTVIFNAAVGAEVEVHVFVRNLGTAPAFSCILRSYDSPFPDPWQEVRPLSDFALRRQKIISVHPGQRVLTTIGWWKSQTMGEAVFTVLDPIVDRRSFASIGAPATHRQWARRHY